MNAVETQDSEIRQELMKIVIEEGMIGAREVAADDKLSDLNIASADFMMILMSIEDKFGVYVTVDEKLTSAETVGQLLDVIVERIHASRKESAQ
jgi:acyl carrier protein